jgi:ATP-dependent Clp protease protease subunit
MCGCMLQATDIVIQAQEISRLKTLLCDLYGSHCGRTSDAVMAALERDNFMSPQEARDFGLIDEIVNKRRESK